jgi:hypothetical protein
MPLSIPTLEFKLQAEMIKVELAVNSDRISGDPVKQQQNTAVAQ